MKRSLKLFISTMVFVSAFVSAQGSELESGIVLKTRSGEIYGSKLTPIGDDRKVVVLFINGSGPTDRDGNNPTMQNNSIAFLATELCDAGIASVRYDKRGIGASVKAGQDEAQMRLTDYVEDVKAWIDTLAQHYEKIVIAGHSEGALIGTMASAGNPDVGGLVCIAGAGFRAGDVLKKQLVSFSPEIVEVAIPITDSLMNGKLVQNVPPTLYSLFRPSIQPYMISWLNIDPAIELKNTDCPVLIVQGDRDIQVSVDNALRLAKARPDARLVVIPGMNHVLKFCATDEMDEQMPTYSNPELPNVAGVGVEIVDFVRSVKRSPNHVR